MSAPGGGSGIGQSEIPTPCSCSKHFLWLGAAWIKSRAERPSVSGVNLQLHVQIGCKLGIRSDADCLAKERSSSWLLKTCGKGN